MANLLYLLSTSYRQWLAEPEGTSYQFEEGFLVEDEDLLEDWAKPLVEDEDGIRFIDDRDPKVLDIAQEEEVPFLGGWTYVIDEWTPIKIFLTLESARSFAKENALDSEGPWRVTPVRCSGELIAVLQRDSAQPGGQNADP